MITDAWIVSMLFLSALFAVMVSSFFLFVIGSIIKIVSNMNEKIAKLLESYNMKVYDLEF